MKKKILLSLIIIILILISVGCEFSPGCTEWMRAEEAVYSYWQAITNRQYELAKEYCVPDGVWYNKTDGWEEYINANSEGEASVIIHTPYFHEQTEVIGNNAVVYATINIDIIPFPSSNTIDGYAFEYEIELIKQTFPPGDWKLK